MPIEIQVRRDTQANWTANSTVVPASGEWCFESDTNRVKIGDGSTTWASLLYSSNPRITLITGNTATPAINTDKCDEVHITGQTTGINTFTSSLTGTPVEGQVLVIAVSSSSQATTLAWGTSFESSSITLPTSLSAAALSGANYRLDITLIYNSETSKWRCVGVA